MWQRGHFQWHHLPTKFQENPQNSSKFISGGTDKQTYRQAGDLISPLSFFGSRLKINKKYSVRAICTEISLSIL
jgi:hypothetical protein